MRQTNLKSRLDFLGPLVVAATTLVMLIWTWDRGPDPIIDYGRELYLPWRITEGEVLYRDMRYFNGPLAPYVNALLFRVGGVGLSTLQTFNAFLILAVAALVYRLVNRLAGAVAATAAGVAFPILFACAHLGFGGTFNWLTPYSTDLTFGIALALALLVCLGKAEHHANDSHSRGVMGWALAAGGLFGLVLLTKVEVALAAAVGAATALAGIMWQVLPPRRARAFLTAATFLGAAVIPVALAVTMLARHMTIDQALNEMFGAWQFIGDERISRIRFYQWVLGTEDLGDSLFKLAAWTLAYAALIGASYALGVLAASRGTRAAVATSAGWALVLFVLGVVYWQQIPWNGALRPIPILLVGAAAWAIVARHRAAAPRTALSLGLIVFAALLLAKMMFNVRAPHYGFALVMPGTAVAIAVLVGWLPRSLGVAGWPIRAAALALLALLLATALITTDAWRRRYTVPVGFGRDQFFADRERGQVVQALLEDLRGIARERPDVTLMAIPEGLMINYLSRRVNPTGHQNVMPLEMVMYGEDRMAADLAARPPDYVALVHADHEIHGAKFFGRDYGFKLDAWLRTHYRPVKLYGEMPFSGEHFGILLMKREE